VTAFGYAVLQYVSTFHPDTNSVLHCEIHSRRFPEKLCEQQEVTHIGCQSKRSTVIQHFAGIVACMQIVCKVKIHKAKSAAAQV
jgi:hypothetical protein